jgi:Family of unknown function (DUF6252)
MQITRGVRVAAAALMALASGCIADSPQNFRLNARVDGVAFDATGVVANIENSVLTIAGTSRGEFLNLRVNMPATPGTVSLNADTLAISKGEVIAGTTTWSTVFGGSGTVTFTKTLGGEIAGTFSFSARITPLQSGASAREVAQGSFSVRF